MLPVFIYWFYLQITGRTVFPRRYAFTNVLIIFAVLKGLTLLMPVSAFRLGFTNGLMSESMVIWFAFMLAFDRRSVCLKYEGGTYANVLEDFFQPSRRKLRSF